MIRVRANLLHVHFFRTRHIPYEEFKPRGLTYSLGAPLGLWKEKICRCGERKTDPYYQTISI
jgi:hypothetical protein